MAFNSTTGLGDDEGGSSTNYDFGDNWIITLTLGV